MPELCPIEPEFASTEEAVAHDHWVREKVGAASSSPKPRVPHDQVMAGMRAIIKEHSRAGVDPER